LPPCIKTDTAAPAELTSASAASPGEVEKTADEWSHAFGPIGVVRKSLSPARCARHKAVDTGCRPLRPYDFPPAATIKPP
jgi:hypothetical protein